LISFFHHRIHARSFTNSALGVLFLKKMLKKLQRKKEKASIS